MQKIKHVVVTGMVLLLLSCNSYSQYNIRIETFGWQDTFLILGFYMGDNMYVADTVAIDHKGVAIIKSDTLLPNGIYTAYYPDKNYFDFLVSGDQTFKVTFDTAGHRKPKPAPDKPASPKAMKPVEHKGTDYDLLTSQNITGSDEARAFSEYHKFMNQMQIKRSALLDHYKPLVSNKDSLAVAQRKMEALNKAVNERWDRDYKAYEGTFYGTVIRSFIPVEFKPGSIPGSSQNKDSLMALQKYNFEANHFFDHTDLTEPGLWRTSFHQKRIEYYLNHLLLPRPDSITPYAIKLIEASKPDKQCFRLMTNMLLNYAVKSDIMGMESMSIAIAKKYFLSGEATWADSTMLAKLAELVAKDEHTLLGAVAPELVMEDWHQGFQSLHQVESPYTILIFFEPNCSHCKKIIPEVYEKIWNKYKDKGLAVYCVYTQTNKAEWEEFIHEKELYDWIHVWDPHNATNFRYYYDVSVTPRMFLLDKDKVIIGKKIGVENLDLMLDRLYKFGKL